MKSLIKQLAVKFIMFVKRVCALTTRQAVCVCVIAVALSTAVMSLNVIISLHHRSIEISLNYDGAQYGLTPSKGRFDISKIKSDEVIKNAIAKVNDKSLTVENVKPRITIDAKMPKSAIDKTVASISSGGSYSYTPAEFVVYYSQQNKFGKNYTVEFLNALAESYNEFFAKTYLDKNTVLKFDGGEKLNGYDYDEICQSVTDSVNSMINYLGHKQSLSADFVSSDTGYKFSELVTALENLRDIDIEKLRAYVRQNRVSKNKDTFLNKKKYLIDNETRNYDYLHGASEISNKSLRLYDARISGVAFVPTVDAENEFYMSRTKTGIDNLSKLSYKNGIRATEIKKTIDDYTDKYNSFNKAAQSTADMNAAAEIMISEIENRLSGISDLAIRTDNEYIAKKNKNYISFVYPGEQKLPFTSWVKNIILYVIILTAGIRILRILKRFLLGIAGRKGERS